MDSESRKFDFTISAIVKSVIDFSFNIKYVPGDLGGTNYMLSGNIPKNVSIHRNDQKWFPTRDGIPCIYMLNGKEPGYDIYINDEYRYRLVPKMNIKMMKYIKQTEALWDEEEVDTDDWFTTENTEQNIMCLTMTSRFGDDFRMSCNGVEFTKDENNLYYLPIVDQQCRIYSLKQPETEYRIEFNISFKLEENHNTCLSNTTSSIVDSGKSKLSNLLVYLGIPVSG